MDTSKVSQGEMVAGISALALFIFLFLPWYGIDSVGGFGVGDLGGSLSAWEAFSFIDVLLFLVSAIVVGLVLAHAADATPELPWPPALIVAVAGGVALVLILFRLLVTPDLDTSGIDIDVDLGRKIGIFLGLISAAGIAYGGWRAMNEPVAAAPGDPDARRVPPPAPPASSPPPSTSAGGAAPSTGGTQPANSDPAPPAPPPPAAAPTPPAAPSPPLDPTPPAGGSTPPAGGSTPPPAPPSGDQPPAGGQTPQP